MVKNGRNPLGALISISILSSTPQVNLTIDSKSPQPTQVFSVQVQCIFMYININSEKIHLLIQ